MTPRCREVVSRWQRGGTADDIANALGTSDATVYNELRKARESGLEVDAYRTNPRLAARRDRIAALWNARVPTEDIAEHVGVSTAVVHADLKVLRSSQRSLLSSSGRVLPEHDRRQHQIRQSAPHVERRRAKVEEMWNQHMTMGEIAEAIGVRKKMIERDLSKLLLEGRIQRHQRGKRPSPVVAARRERVANLWNADIPVREIAKELDVDPKMVTHDAAWLRDKGYRLRFRGGTSLGEPMTAAGVSRVS